MVTFEWGCGIAYGSVKGLNVVVYSGADALPLAMQDLLCMNNDFPPRAHCLVRW